MKSENLENFDICYFMDLIKNKMPFYNERHFQCELGSAIKMYFKENKYEDIDVLYEMYYPTDEVSSVTINEEDETIKSITKTKRNYTDIVISDTKTEEYIAIELKYGLSDSNTKDSKRFNYSLSNGDEISIAKKGALDNCRYDYLYDVYRLESLKRLPNSPYQHKTLKHFISGYAVLLSNAQLMWKSTNRSVNYEKFRVDDNAYTSGDYKWTGGINTKPDAVRPEIKGLNGKKYLCKWLPENSSYFEDINKKSPLYRYLVIKVE